MPGMMMKKDKPAAKPMAYKEGGMVKKPGAKQMPMHKMPNGKMMPGAMHGAKAKK
jgi:hypothetical protein